MIPTQENFDYAVNLLLDNITNRYERFCRKSKFGSVEDKINQFADELNIETGRKYLKITAGSSVWGFVNLTNPKFKLTVIHQSNQVLLVKTNHLLTF